MTERMSGRARAGRPVNLELRSAVLVATGELLAEHGYDSVTMEAIATRAGAAKQTLYRIWGSKAEVVADAVLQGSFVLQAAPVPNTGALRADLISWLNSVSGYLRQPGVSSVVRALAVASAGTADRERADAFERVLTRPVSRLIVDRIANGRSTGDLPGHVSVAATVDLIVGYLTLVSIGQAPLDEDRVRELVVILVPESPAPLKAGAGHPGPDGGRGQS
ncbi:TetR/AcrR family transcriptional regulator [Streptomyces sp. NPDC048282]|uniref:TetR/AcrR family transcriptional regulator n=1 Tax=Streptomyces sp. NPDC048282 TaxID=3365528 RepID=UPI003715A067